MSLDVHSQLITDHQCLQQFWNVRLIMESSW